MGDYADSILNSLATVGLTVIMAEDVTNQQKVQRPVSAKDDLDCALQKFHPVFHLLPGIGKLLRDPFELANLTHYMVIGDVDATSHIHLQLQMRQKMFLEAGHCPGALVKDIRLRCILHRQKNACAVAFNEVLCMHTNLIQHSARAGS